MKRLLPLLLLLCLLLTACSGSKGNKDILSDLPAQGNVKTDFSHYTPGKQSEYLYTRISEAPLTELQPVDDATMIYPFIGQDLRLSTTDQDRYSVHPYRYGFADDKGRLLADPIYYDVAPLREHHTDECLPFWVMRKMNSEEPVGYYINSFMDPIYGYCGFASTDGSVVTECKYIEVRAYEDRIVAQRYTDPTSTDHDSLWEAPLSYDVYDLNGDLLFSSDELPFADMLRRHSFNLQYSEGLYVVQLEEGGQINHYFMDEDFRLVLGPYPDAQPFSEGYAAVQISKYKSTYIDKKGNPLPDTYTNCEPFRNSCAIVESYAGRYSMIDTEGTVIATLSSWPFPFSDGYYYVRDYEDVVDPTSFHGYRTAEVIRCYNSRGRELWSEFDGDILSPDLVFHSYYGSGSLLKNVSLGTFVEVFESHPSLVGPATEPFVVLRFRNSYFGYRIFTKELMELPYDRSFDPTISRWQTGSIEDTALALPHKNGSRIYTTPNDAIGVYPVWEFRQGILYSDNTVAFTDSSYTKLYDADGKLFFSYPLILLGD